MIDSSSGSPLTLEAPCEIPNESLNRPNLPTNLSPLFGKLTQNRRTENDRKIVLYILSADECHNNAKSVLNDLYTELKENSKCRGFELQLCDLHEKCENFLDPKCWVNEPIEARGGHHLAAECLSEISRHSNNAYIIPILFLGANLGSPLLPLTIECQDFIGAMGVTENSSNERQLLERWYILDDKAEPTCYRLNTNNNTATTDELNNLYKVLIDIFSKELRDSYLTTVIEQEINNMVFINQEISKRCIWIHTGALPLKNIDESSGESAVAIEMNRRLNNIQLDLKVIFLQINFIHLDINSSLFLFTESII